MAYSATLTKFGVLGDLKYEIYTLTDVADDSSGTVVSRMLTPMIAIPVCEKAASDVINVVSISGQTITIDASTSGDDGKLMVIGK